MTDLSDNPFYKNIILKSDAIVKELDAKDLDDAIKILKEKLEVKE